MSESIYIKQTQILVELNRVLKQFAGVTLKNLAHINNKLRKVLDGLNNKLIADKKYLESCIDNVHYAHRNLEACEAQEDDDYIPDCSNELSSLNLAKTERHKAEIQLDKTRNWVRRVEKQIMHYKKISLKLERFISFDFAKAGSFLSSKISEINNYLQLSQGDSQTSTTSSSIQNINSDSNNNSSSSSSSSSSNSNSNSNSKNDTRDNSSFINNMNAVINKINTRAKQGTNKWVNKGINNVKLSELPDVDGISGASDFKKVSMNEMKDGLQKLKHINNVMNQGNGNDSFYWSEFDKQKNLSYSDGYQRIYEAFYGGSAIKVTKDGNQYSITNGRHRIWLAKQLGIKLLPAIVVEKT